MNNLLGDFSANVRKKDMFKPTIWNEISHKINNDDCVRVLDFVADRNPKYKFPTSQHLQIYLNDTR
jgi:hypothetical protein